MDKDTKSNIKQGVVEDAEIVEAKTVDLVRNSDGEKSAEVGDAEGVVVNAADSEQDLISWEAQEYIVRDKTTGWYVGLIVIGLVLSGVAVWLQWWTFLTVIVLSVVALMIYAMRPPRVLSYGLTRTGVREGEHLYPYENFKSFGILQEGGNFAIILTPRKRFSPRLTVFFPQEQGEKIVDAFGARLPMEEVKLDVLDKLIKFLRI